jgi:hypothetical protein
MSLNGDLLTPFQVQELMLTKSLEVDTAIAEYRAKSVAHVEARRLARIAMNTSLLSIDAKTVDLRKAIAEKANESEVYAEDLSEALRNSALEALRARREQLNALNALAYTIRTEMQLQR